MNLSLFFQLPKKKARFVELNWYQSSVWGRGKISKNTQSDVVLNLGAFFVV
jgi:hypothetical protein